MQKRSRDALPNVHLRGREEARSFGAGGSRGPEHEDVLVDRDSFALCPRRRAGGRDCPGQPARAYSVGGHLARRARYNRPLR